MAEQVNVADIVDRIGSLPDEVLRHILSFLPTKAAVSTCVLSTRWRYLFPFSNNLDFHDLQVLSLPRDKESRDDQTDRFLNFVDQCIMRMNATPVDKFCFECLGDVDTSRVNSWIGAAPLQNVRELDLHIRRTRDLGKEQPLRIFSCNTLVVLKLSTDSSLNVPASVSFPCLKSLHLDRIKFRDDVSAQRLFSSCPVIEDLVIQRCSMDYTRVLNLSSPSLKILTFDKRRSVFPSFRLLLDAPSLVYLKYTICAGEDYTIRNLHSLLEADISFEDDIYFGPFSSNDRIALTEFLKGISSAQSLSIYGDFSQPPLEWDRLPLLENLTRLVLVFKPFIALSLVIKLLRCTPNLEEFIIDGGIRRDAHEDWCVDDVPSCVSSHLKAITCCHHGSCIEKDLESLEYFMKNANVLKRMWIYIVSFPFEEEAAAKMLMMTETFDKLRLSKRCEIKFFRERVDCISSNIGYVSWVQL